MSPAAEWSDTDSASDLVRRAAIAEAAVRRFQRRSSMRASRVPKGTRLLPSARLAASDQVALETLSAEI